MGMGLSLDQREPKGTFAEPTWLIFMGFYRQREVWKRFYSTPFAFLTDAFTGEFLCGVDVGRGHIFSSDFSHLTTLFIPVRCGDVSPHMGIDPILYHTTS